MKAQTVTITKNEQVSPRYYHLELVSPKIKTILPGQFMMLSFLNRIDPLLPRPMGFFKILHYDKNDTTVFTVGYVVVGKGTKLLAEMKPGEKLRFVGPLGNGWFFDKIKSNTETLLIAGGIGITPLYEAAKTLIGKNVKTKLLYGAPSSEELVFVDEFEKLKIDMELYTDNGTKGKRGFVTSELAQHIKPGTSILACGPEAMLKTVDDICIEHQTDPQLSFDKRMACGFGVCLGCNISIKTREGEHFQKRVCKEGPVFMGSEVSWKYD